MTQTGRVYGLALYQLAREEHRNDRILGQLEALNGCFSGAPEYLRLLAAPNIPKAERCRILDDGFQGKVDVYILNFLKILIKKGHIRHFPDCVETYRQLYNEDSRILQVTAVTAAQMTQAQMQRLARKMRRITGRHIELTNRIDPEILGGVRLESHGQWVDGTLAHRLSELRRALADPQL